jgi:hypothetical protein
MTDNTATDELRRMLRERGVEYRTVDFGLHDTRTDWEFGDGGAASFRQMFAGDETMFAMKSDGVCVAPTRAIAMTLGREKNTDGLPTGLTVSDDGMLLNWRGENYVRQSGETVERGTCRWVWNELWDDTDAGRECMYANWVLDCGCWSGWDERFSEFDDYGSKPEGINFCERCGREVRR